jgi:hypothetical protein
MRETNSQPEEKEMPAAKRFIAAATAPLEGNAEMHVPGERLLREAITGFGTQPLLGQESWK